MVQPRVNGDDLLYRFFADLFVDGLDRSRQQLSAVEFRLAGEPSRGQPAH